MLLRALVSALFVTLVAAQSNVLAFTRVPNPVTDGEAAVLLWQTNDTTKPCEITLQKGPSADLKTVEVLTKAATGGQYIWHPPVSLADGNDYVLLIKQGSQNNTFGPFTVQGANPSAVSKASASASSTKHTASLGTGTAMHRNTTMSHPTLTHHATPKVTTTKTTKTTPAIASSSSAAAVPHISTSSSSFALVLGAVAAIFYLH